MSFNEKKKFMAVKAKRRKSIDNAGNFISTKWKTKNKGNDTEKYGIIQKKVRISVKMSKYRKTPEIAMWRNWTNNGKTWRVQTA